LLLGYGGLKKFLSRVWGFTCVSCAVILVVGMSFLMIKYAAGIIAILFIVSQVVFLVVRYIPEFRSKSQAA